MDIDPRIFLGVPLNTLSRSACSPPDPGPAWRGIVIRAPSRVTFRRGETVGDHGAFTAIPICGYLAIDVRLDRPSEPAKLVARDRNTGRVFSGAVVELDPSPELPPPDEPPLTPEEVQGTAGATYFNYNLADYVPLPHVAASYDIHAELWELRSNVVTIELLEGS